MDEATIPEPEVTQNGAGTKSEVDPAAGEHPAIEYYYPFHSSVAAYNRQKGLTEGKDYKVWAKEGFDLQEAVRAIDRPIVEIGGPSEEGYYFLDSLALPSRPHITNIALPHEMPDSAHLVEELVDGRNLPYDDGSLGVVLAQAMNHTELGRESINTAEGNDIFSKALEELNAVAVGSLKPEDAVNSLRIKIYLEIRRALQNGGLLISTGRDRDIKALEKMGFELVGYMQDYIDPSESYGGDHGVFYEFVMRKIE